MRQFAHVCNAFVFSKPASNQCFYTSMRGFV